MNNLQEYSFHRFEYAIPLGESILQSGIWRFRRKDLFVYSLTVHHYHQSKKIETIHIFRTADHCLPMRITKIDHIRHTTHPIAFNEIPKYVHQALNETFIIGIYNESSGIPNDFVIQYHFCDNRDTIHTFERLQPNIDLDVQGKIVLIVQE